MPHSQSDPGSTPSNESSRDVLAVGARLQRYEILSVLGQGSFGVTYRARDTQLDRDVALKEYLPTALAVRESQALVLPRSTKLADEFGLGRQRFVDEGRTLATLHHAPAIVRIFDFIEANGTAYIVMELVPGITLQDHLAHGKTLSPAEIDRILWPLLDGLTQVHAAGFLHRDIKPGNIILNGDGYPTLIDFGAARAAMAGRTIAMTTIFTPGYAAAEQFTSARQGPWTDIYGLSATLYHAITGEPPPSAFDRMLDDHYRPLGKQMPAGFAPGLLIGIDAGLAVRAGDRPQSIVDWRPILTQSVSPDSQVTTVLGEARKAAATPPEPVRSAADAPTIQRAAAPAGRARHFRIGLALAAIALAAGGYYIATDGRSPQRAAEPPPRAAETEAAAKAAQAEAQAQAQAQAQAEELAKLRAEKEARDKAEAAAKQKADEETHQREAELARQKADQEARQAAAIAAEEARRKAEESERAAAEAGEIGLRLASVDRQHVQVALTALGFDTGGTDGIFGKRTRDMIMAWQRSRNDGATGFLSGKQNQALLQSAAPAITQFDADQRAAAAVSRPSTSAMPTTPTPPAPSPRTASTPPAPVPGSVSQEPPPGALRAGERVLVDDGTCPADQIKEVTGGGNLSTNRTTGPPRSKKCIPRSSVR